MHFTDWTLANNMDRLKGLFFTEQSHLHICFWNYITLFAFTLTRFVERPDVTVIRQDCGMGSTNCIFKNSCDSIVEGDWICCSCGSCVFPQKIGSMTGDRALSMFSFTHMSLSLQSLQKRNKDNVIREPSIFSVLKTRLLLRLTDGLKGFRFWICIFLLRVLALVRFLSFLLWSSKPTHYIEQFSSCKWCLAGFFLNLEPIISISTLDLFSVIHQLHCFGGIENGTGEC